MSTERDTEAPNKDTARRPRIFYGWWIVSAGMTIHLWVSICWVYGMQVFFTPLADYFGWSRALISGAFALQRLEGRGRMAPPQVVRARQDDDRSGSP